MRDLLYKVAEVLDAQAREEDARASAPVPTAKQATEAPRLPTPAENAEKIASAYRERTGEELPLEIQAKLDDPAVAEFAAKLAGVGGARTPLGEAQDVGGAPDAPSHVEKSGRVTAAWDRFGEFLAGQHR